jgi:predicted ATPase/DNA-binding SARP family transcriptional activator
VVAVRVLGPFELRGPDDEVVAVGSTLRCKVLGALVLHRDAVLTPEALAELVWDDPPANPANAVQTHITRLRRVLPPAVALATEQRGYRLHVEAADLDVARFERLLAEAEAEQDPMARSELLGAALGLWRGTPYPELDHPSVLPEVARLSEARLSAVERRAAALLAAGSADDAVAVLQALVVEAPLREGPVALLMRALVGVGRQGDALRAFARLRGALAEELGIDPSPELRALEAQVLAQELEVVPLPLPAAGGARPSGPALPASTFVGRDAELDAAAGLLASHRVVTLHGAGGVGKSRLARHVAVAVADRFPDGVTLVDLSAVRVAERVREAVAVALRLELRGEEPLDQHLLEVLSVGRRLLVLDGCEHLVDEVAGFVEEVLAAAAGTCALVTTREALRVDGEQVVRLGPLEPAAAAALFVDRMRAAGHPEPDDEAHDLVAQVCERLDLLPLAIELAAARAPTVGLAGLLAGLDHRFELLRSGRRGGVSHHRSLREVVEWSYDLLEPVEREVFRRFAVFAGAVALADAVAVIADEDLPPSVVRAVLPDLVDRSLVVTVPWLDGTAYRLLDTLRAFGREVLGPDEGGVQARHVAWALQLVEEVTAGQRTADEARWARRVDLVLADLLQAHRWLGEGGDVGGQLTVTAALGRHSMFRYRLDIARLIERTIAESGHVVHPATPEVLGCGGTVAWQRGRFAEAEELSRRALEMAEAVGDPLAARFGRDVIANVAMFRGDTERARAEAEAVIALSTSAGDGATSLGGYVDLVLTLAYAGDDAGADEAEARAAVLVEEMDAPLWRGWYAYVCGERRAPSDPATAARLLEEAVAMAQSTGSPFLAGVARHTLVTTAARSLEPAEAVAAHLPVVEHWHRSGAWNQLWVALRSLIGALARLGRHREAALLLGAHEASPRAARAFGPDQRLLDEARQRLQAALGEDLDRALAEGAALGDDRAVALALDAMRRVPAPPTP